MGGAHLQREGEEDAKHLNLFPCRETCRAPGYMPGFAFSSSCLAWQIVCCNRNLKELLPEEREGWGLNHAGTGTPLGAAQLPQSGFSARRWAAPRGSLHSAPSPSPSSPVADPGSVLLEALGARSNSQQAWTLPRQGYTGYIQNCAMSSCCPPPPRAGWVSAQGIPHKAQARGEAQI